jgi:hypothetical protein
MCCTIYLLEKAGQANAGWFIINAGGFVLSLDETLLLRFPIDELFIYRFSFLVIKHFSYLGNEVFYAVGKTA